MQRAARAARQTSTPGRPARSGQRTSPFSLGKVGDCDSRSLGELSSRREALATFPLFALLEREPFRVLSVTEVRSHFPGETIFDQDAAGGDLEVVLSGTVGVCRSGSLVSEVRTGQHLGDVATARAAALGAGAGERR